MTSYIDEAERAFWADEIDDYLRWREFISAQKREYRETGYWYEPQEGGEKE